MNVVLMTREPRVRPGESPQWTRLTLDAERWRAAAASARLHVDELLAIALEWELVRQLVIEIGIEAENLIRHARLAAHAARLAPTPELRDWLRPSASSPQDDDLPDACLPARLLMRADDVNALTDGALERWQDAITLDRAAALEGMTLEVWALHAALVC